MKTAAALLAAVTLVSGCSTTVAEPTPVPSASAIATVVSVHDGDSIRLNLSGLENVRVRLIGIDAPEVGAERECYADEATALLRDLLPEGAEVRIQQDRDPFDRYERHLFYVFTVEGENVSLGMVEQGAAEAVRIGNNDLYWDELLAAERRARDAGLGMWGACG